MYSYSIRNDHTFSTISGTSNIILAIFFFEMYRYFSALWIVFIVRFVILLTVFLAAYPRADLINNYAYTDAYFAKFIPIVFPAIPPSLPISPPNTLVAAPNSIASTILSPEIFSSVKMQFKAFLAPEETPPCKAAEPT